MLGNIAGHIAGRSYQNDNFPIFTDFSDFLGRLRRRESTFHLYEVKVESRFSRKPSGGPREPRGGPENLGRRRVPEVRDTDDDDYYYVAGLTGD